MQPSRLRIQQSASEPISAHTTAASFPHTISPRPEKRQKLGLAATYRLAQKARGKLSYEASRSDHDLRLLVLHANTLDDAMISLSFTPPEPQRVAFQDEQHYLDASDEDDEADSQSDSDSEEEIVAPSILAERRQRARSPPPRPYHHVEDDEDMVTDDDSEDSTLRLVRTRSHSPSPCPDLVHDSDDSDEESGPSSPESCDAPIITKDFAVAAQKQQQELPKEHLDDHPYYTMSAGQPPSLVAAY